MKRSIAVLFGAAWLAACGGTSVQGKVVNARTGAAAGGFTLKASATADSASITCQFFEAEVAEDGSFSFPDLCGGTPYALESMQEDIWLGDVAEIPEGGFEGPFELKIWKAPKGSGLWRLPGDGTMDPVKTGADIKQEKIKKSEEMVTYPSNIPKNVPLVKAEEELLIVGNPSGLNFYPLIQEPEERKFGDDETTVTMQPWWYVGKDFTSHTEWEEKTAELDMSKVEDKADDSRSARWMKGSALPPGRYAAWKDTDRRMFIIDFGAPPSE